MYTISIYTEEQNDSNLGELQKRQIHFYTNLYIKKNILMTKLI